MIRFALGLKYYAVRICKLLAIGVKHADPASTEESVCAIRFLHRSNIYLAVSPKAMIPANLLNGSVFLKKRSVGGYIPGKYDMLASVYGFRHKFAFQLRDYLRGCPCGGEGGFINGLAKCGASILVCKD